MYQNIAQNITGPTTPIDFEATLQINGQALVKMNVTLDAEGITLSTKKDNVRFPRSVWLDEAMLDKTIVLHVHGITYQDWGKKRKFEKKNPGEEFTDFTPAAAEYIMIVNPKRLVTVSLEELKQALDQVFLLAYLDDGESGKSAHIIQCPGCAKMMDITPYKDTENIFCPECSKTLNEPEHEGKAVHGICSGCGFYTKLVEYKTAVESIVNTKVEKKKTCHPCRVKNTIKAFFITLAAVIGIGLINVLSLMADRYFPVLIIIGVVMFLVNIFTLFKVLVYSAARKAVGASDIENAVTAVRKGNTDEAFSIISNMDDNMAENPGLMLNLAKGLITAGDYEKANQMVDNLIAKFPNFHFAYIEKINILVKTGASEEELAKAEAELSAVLGRNNIQSPDRFLLAAAVV